VDVSLCRPCGTDGLILLVSGTTVPGLVHSAASRLQWALRNTILLRGWTFGAQELENRLLRLHHFVDNHLAAFFGVDDLVHRRIAT
jgi:hypothetical protein